METRTVTEHRAWIEQTLGSFRVNGFAQFLESGRSQPVGAEHSPIR